MQNSRHIPYPDWIHNVPVTCKKSHKYHTNSFSFRQHVGICRKVAPKKGELILNHEILITKGTWNVNSITLTFFIYNDIILMTCKSLP